MSIPERLRQLREKMVQAGIDYVMIPTSDYHDSEYVGEYFKCRAYMTGFTGSAGTAVVGREDAFLWTDGRYFVQAEKQLQGSTVGLMRDGTEGTPTVRAFLKERLKDGGVLMVDGRVISVKEAEGIRADKITLRTDRDLVGEIWADRPERAHSKAWILDTKYAGRTAAEKLEELRSDVKALGGDVHILTSLDDLCWLLNLRGDDATHFPILLSYGILAGEDFHYFLQEEALTDEVASYLKKEGVILHAYDEVEAFVQSLPKNQKIVLTKERVQERLVSLLPEGSELIDSVNPTTLRKAVKNPVEIENLRLSHLYDGIAVTRFMRWVKDGVKKERLTEWSVTEELQRLREKRESLVDLSFGTITAYGGNAAMMHYSPSKEKDTVLEEKGFLLVDSGGHYLEGTTDITRTFALGELTEKEKSLYTSVLRSHLNLQDAKFLYGTSGLALDILSREPLWCQGIDYRCGTGHGVGYLLNVHEGPNSFRWRSTKDRPAGATLEVGMVTTDEPGIYIEGELGIRIENELLTVEWQKNEYGQFLCFEPLTYCPYDLDAVNPEEMSREEKKRLNDYHAMVYEKLQPYFDEDEKEWLRHATRAV